MADRFTCRFTLRLYKNDKCFGPGIMALLQGVDEHHSLRRAAREMGISYSKAWNMIQSTQNELGFKLIETTVGGKNGGGAEVSPEAREFMEKYSAYSDEMDTLARELTDRYFNQ